MNKIDKLIRDYDNREITFTSDLLLDCPRCKRNKAMERNGVGWKCLWKDCQYQITYEKILK